MKKLSYYLLALLFVSITTVFTSCGDDDDDTVDSTSTIFLPGTDGATGTASITITDRGLGTGTRNFSKDTVYVLDGLVFVNSGQTLTIEPGTVIKGRPGTGENASALVVARGGTINAEGTATEPIIFTYQGDDLNGVDQTEAEWGGLIILGDASLNSTPGESAIEGISTSENRGLYGGSNDSHDAGTLTYVSIRNGGSDIGADNEINGLTLGGVGSGTTIDFVEIFYNKDDGIEYFGGTVGVTHLVVAYCGDDAIDYDEGYRGVNQFAFVYQGPSRGDRGGEHDGGTSPEDGMPYATPQFWNVTSIGNSGNRVMTMRDNAGGTYNNGIFAEYGRGIDIEFLKDGESSKTRYDAGDIGFNNNTFSNIGADLFTVGLVIGENTDGTEDRSKVPAQTDIDAFTTTLNNLASGNGNSTNDGMISTTNPVPMTANTTVTAGAPTTANYRGAFETGMTAWYEGWTALHAGDLVANPQ